MPSIYARRFFKANDKYLEDYNPEEPSSYLLNIDANNLYGGIMKHCYLMKHILEVDLSIPEELQDYFADYPLAPSREVIGTDQLSNEQIQMLGEMGVTSLPKVPKLVQTLDPKEGYVLHYLTLKLYIELGLRVTKLIKVLKFRQGRWMAPFVDLNTQLRMSARNKFEENFYKLIVNSAFGKTMKLKLGRKKLEIIRNERELLQKTALSTMKSFQIIDEEVATVCFAVTSFLWDKPMIIGASILDLSKRFMFYFHYRQMKASMNLELLYSDTDLFIYAIKTKDVYADLQKLTDSYDFSNYPSDHFLFSNVNKKVVLKFKDEAAGKIIAEFIALKPKLYSLKYAG